jgi:opacity protein-like surface antigen
MINSVLLLAMIIVVIMVNSVNSVWGAEVIKPAGTEEYKAFDLGEVFYRNHLKSVSLILLIQ